MGESFWFGEDDVPQRVALGGVGGYRADTDDVVGELELGEEDINPDAQSRKRHGGAGGGPVGMMPPVGMAQGGGVNVGVAGARGAAAGVVPSGGLVGAGGSGGLGAGGVAGSGVAGTGGAMGAGSGLGAGGFGVSGAGVGTVAAGSSGADYGFGINPATGEPWSVSDPGFAERFGTVDPRSGKYVNPVTGAVYDPTTGRWIHPGAGQGGVIAPGAGGVPGVGFGGTTTPGVGGVLGSGHTVPAGEGITLGGVAGGVAGVGGGGALGGGGARSGVGGVSGPGGGWGGGEYDTGDMATSSKRWDELTERMNTVKAKIDGLIGRASFGLVAHPQGSYGGAVTTASQNAQDSGANMMNTATELAGSAGDYEAIEQENAALGVKVVGK